MDSLTFSHGDAFMIFCTGILLPSGDTVSDIGLSLKLLSKTCDENCLESNKIKHIQIQNLFGWIIWIPIILNTLLTIPHFLRVERTLLQRTLTCPLLVCQCWPQYRSLRVLWFAYVNRNILRSLQEKHEIEANISNLEPFLQAIPQIHLTLILLCQGVLEYQESHDPLNWLSFASSTLSATIGIAKLLKNGPIKAIRHDRYLQPGFLLLIVIAAGNLIGKAAWMGFAFSFHAAEKKTVLSIWALTCLIPQLILVRFYTSYTFVPLK